MMHRIQLMSCLFILCGMMGMGHGSTNLAEAQSEAQPELQIDPLLIAQAAEVWKVIAQPNNPVWPGWNAASTPLLFYFPEVQDVLINHPQPPEGFQRYTGSVTFPGGAIYIRNGRTFFEFDGQNTAVDVAGVKTLVVADTLSNRRSQMIGWLSNPRAHQSKSSELRWHQLQGNPYATICMIAHEAFHVFQLKQAPQKAGHEDALARYPAIVAANTIGLALEGDALGRALRSKSNADLRRYALEWLAIRKERRSALAPEAADYEDRMEFLEGLAKYIEYRLLEVLEGRTSGPAMVWLQGFHGYKDLAKEREQLVQMMEKMMRGEADVNNDPYGASPVRMRHYFSGMAIGVLLDRLNIDWKNRIFQAETTLTQLATEALKPTEAELSSAAKVTRNQPGYAELVEAKRKLEMDGDRATRALVDQIESGPQTTLVIDYAKLGTARPGMAYTPFGILRVSDERTIYRLIPITAKIGDTTMRQTMLSPLLHDRSQKQILFQLSEQVTLEELEKQLRQRLSSPEPITIKEVVLPGVKLSGGKCKVSMIDRRIQVELVR